MKFNASSKKRQMVILSLCISFIFIYCKTSNESESVLKNTDNATIAFNHNGNDISGISWEAIITSTKMVDLVPAKNPQTGRQQLLQSTDGTESFLLVTFNLEKKKGQPGFNTDDAILLVDDKKVDYMGIFMDGEVLTMKPMQLSRNVTRDIQLCFAVPITFNVLSLKLGASNPVILTPVKN
jgi:hypothetical protein